MWFAGPSNAQTIRYCVLARKRTKFENTGERRPTDGVLVGWLAGPLLDSDGTVEPWGWWLLEWKIQHINSGAPRQKALPRPKPLSIDFSKVAGRKAVCGYVYLNRGTRILFFLKTPKE